jgi:phytoene desaturase
VYERFFKLLGKKASDYYSLKRIDPSYRIFWKEGITDVPADFLQLKKVFESIERGSSKKLEAFIEKARIKYEIALNQMIFKPGLSIREYFNKEVIFNSFKLNLLTSIKKEIRKSFKHPKLQMMLEFPVLFLGALPEKTPAMYSLMNYADIKGGTWYPDGGFYSIVRSIYNVALDLGVEFHFEEEIISTSIEEKSIKKVTSNKGEYYTNAVISSADYYFTETALLPPEFKSYPENYWEKRTMAPSGLIFYIGLNKKIKHLLHHNLFFDESFSDHANELYNKLQWPQNPLFYVNVTSKTDKHVAPYGCENLMVLIPVASGLTKDTEEIREHYFQMILKRLEKHTGEILSDAILFKQSYSVSDFKNDYHSYKGNAYGLANTLNQTGIFKPSCRSKKVDNLFYTGQLTVPGPGVPPCLISGEIVAKQVIKSVK